MYITTPTTTRPESQNTRDNTPQKQTDNHNNTPAPKTNMVLTRNCGKGPLCHVNMANNKQPCPVPRAGAGGYTLWRCGCEEAPEPEEDDEDHGCSVM